MRLENFAIVGIVAAAVLVAVAAQTGLLNGPARVLVGSVAGIETPRLDDPAMVRRGAGHYERVCAACHASPDRPDRADALDLSPPPPRLHRRDEPWSPEALFTTIRRGVPGTGMPAWPVDDRDDEVWDMVAFVMQLPDMDSATYRTLVGAEAEARSVPLATCIRCHGEDGRGSPDGAFPRLDIQSPAYLFASLLAFRDGQRSSGFMQSAVAGLRDDELALLANHYGQSVPAAAGVSAALPRAARLPACTACHGPPAPARADFPRLAGQHEAYLRRQLELFTREAPRGGGPFIGLMHQVARELEAPEIDELAAWYAGQP